ncbi:MAG: hypothetical protein ABIR04_02385 [Cypionkella sp.]
MALTSSGHFLHWREKIETTADGWTALIRAGGIHDLAGWMDDTASARIRTALCHKAGIATDPLPEVLRRRDSETHGLVFNYNVFFVEWDDKTIPAAGVSW